MRGSQISKANLSLQSSVPRRDSSGQVAVYLGKNGLCIQGRRKGHSRVLLSKRQILLSKVEQKQDGSRYLSHSYHLASYRKILLGKKKKSSEDIQDLQKLMILVILLFSSHYKRFSNFRPYY